MREVHVLGVGATSFAGEPDASGGLAREAASAALADAGVTPAEVGCVVVAGPAGCGLPELAAKEVHHPPTSGAAALHLAWDLVASGEDDVVLCVGHDVSPNGRAQEVDALAREAADYMRASGATERTFALVAAKNRLQGIDNPRAAPAEPVDATDVLRSTLVAGPLRELMVAPPARGAAAVVLAAGERGRLRACVLVRARDPDGSVTTAIARAAGLAYRRARLGPDDIDLAEIDDPTAAGEVAAYEALQFAPEGQGPDLVHSGFTMLGGVLPVNTSGGALAQGDAACAGALAQVCELTWQLRGEAGRRQVAGARVGLALATSPGGHVGLAILGP